MRSIHEQTTLEVHGDGTRYVVDLAGGGSSALDGSAPADCYISAAGSLTGDTLVAQFGPVDTDTFQFSEKAAQREKRSLTIRFNQSGASVLSADTDGYCGLNAEFRGDYRRRDHLR